MVNKCLVSTYDSVVENASMEYLDVIIIKVETTEANQSLGQIYPVTGSDGYDITLVDGPGAITTSNVSISIGEKKTGCTYTPGHYYASSVGEYTIKLEKLSNIRLLVFLNTNGTTYDFKRCYNAHTLCSAISRDNVNYIVNENIEDLVESVSVYRTETLTLKGYGYRINGIPYTGADGVKLIFESTQTKVVSNNTQETLLATYHNTGEWEYV